MAKQADKALKGQVVLVTGAAKRLGRASVLALAAQGADVAITYLKSAREAERTAADIRKLGARCAAIACDVTSEESVRATVRRVVDEFGGLDILINNAGTYESVEFGKITLAQWDAIFASNTRGPFLVSREALKSLRKRKGRIIHLGSLGGVRPWSDHAHYCSSKAALHMLTRVMAKALAPEISVNCVAPGMIDLQEKAASEFMKRMAKITPMKRNGTAEDVAAAVMFFATSPRFITGQLMVVDGGLALD